MENIFNRKIIFLRKKRVCFNYALYNAIENTILGDLSDYFLMFGNSEAIKRIILFNAKNNEVNSKIKSELKNAEIINFDFLENDLENISNINNLQKNDLTVGINSFHNVNYLEGYFSAIFNSMNDNGILCGNFFGRENLSELKKIIINNDAEFSKEVHHRFNPTISPESVATLLQKYRFRNIVISPEKINFEFNFNDAMNFLRDINERNYFSQMQKKIPSRKIFTKNIPEKITLDFDIIKFYCIK